MKYCKHCQISYDAPLEKCLICNHALSGSDESVYKYQSYQGRGKLSILFYKIWIFINFVSILTTLFLDYYMNKSLNWSSVVAISNVYAILISALIYKKTKWQAQIFGFIILTIMEVIAVGFVIEDYTWALDYVYPLSLIFNMFIFTMIILFSKARYHHESSYLFMAAILGFTPLILVLLNIPKTHWPSIASIGYAFITLLGIFLFSSKKAKEELSRRFHV